MKPHPLNVIGDFYVEDGCCTLCDVPRTEAPNLFALTETEDHCFVRRQPQTDDETMAGATWSSIVMLIGFMCLMTDTMTMALRGIWRDGLKRSMA